jgi:hypothetical protein
MRLVTINEVVAGVEQLLPRPDNTAATRKTGVSLRV